MYRIGLGVLLGGVVACGGDYRVNGYDQRCSRAFGEEVLAFDPEAGGLPGPTFHKYTDPEEALGEPDFSGNDSDNGAVSLGYRGYIELGLGECRAVTSGDSQPDIHVEEVGHSFESTLVFIRLTPLGAEAAGMAYEPDLWIGAGHAGSSGKVDLDDVFDSTEAVEFDAIRVQDMSSSWDYHAPTPGADLDAVEALYPVSFGE